MAKEVFICPNCNNSSTYAVERSIMLYTEITDINFDHLLIRCDTCSEITYKIIRTERISKGIYVPPEIKAEEKFQYPFGYFLLEPDLPTSIKQFYVEANNCYKIGALKAAASMSRATISAICDDQKSTDSDLKKRIENLPLSTRLKQVAKNIKWVGDKTIHNEVDWAKAKWDKKTIEEILTFIARIIDDLYTQERKARELNRIVSKAGKGGKN